MGPEAPGSNYLLRQEHSMKVRAAPYYTKKMANKLQGTTKRFGPRYGRTTKNKLEKIETLAKAKYKCPKCAAKRVKRVSAGIWNCTKCKHTFTGKAYYVQTSRKTNWGLLKCQDINVLVAEKQLLKNKWGKELDVFTVALKYYIKLEHPLK